MDTSGALIMLFVLFVTVPLWPIAWNIHNLTKEVKRLRRHAGEEA
jgi:hypothetical protein